MMLNNNHMKTVLKPVLWVSLSLLTFTLQAQETQEKSNGLDLGVIQEIELEIDLDSAQRLYPQEIQIENNTEKPAKQTYETSTFEEPELETLNPKIKIFTIKPQPKDPLLGNYIRLGYGNYASPYAKLFINNKRKDNMSWGINFDHESSTKGPVDGKNSGYYENYGEAFAEFYKKQNTYRVEMNYELNKNRFYGLVADKPQDYEYDYNRVSKFGAVLGLNNASTKKDFNYDASLEFYSLNAKQPEDSIQDQLTESYVSLLFTPEYKLNNDARIKADIDYTFISLGQLEDRQRHYFKVKPTYDGTSGELSYQIGFNLVYSNDTLNGEKQVHFYPHLAAQYKMPWLKSFQFYGELSGDMEKQTYYKRYSENPWLSTQTYLQNTNKLLTFEVGAGGNFSERLRFDFHIGYESYRNFWMDQNYVYDGYNTKFGLAYAKSASRVNVGGAVGYKTKERLDVLLTADYYSYGVQDFDAAFHRPSFETKLLTQTALTEKLLLNTNFFILTGIKALDNTTTEVVTLDAIVDMNAGVEYRFNKRSSAFFNLNNILSKKYERYYHYKVQGINFTLGLTYSF